MSIIIKSALLFLLFSTPSRSEDIKTTGITGITGAVNFPVNLINPEFYSSSMQFEAEKSPLVFPLFIRIGDATATLNADGTATGDGKAFRAALVTLRADRISPGDLAAIWMIAHVLP